MGSKNRIAKHILPFILNELDKDTKYVEPFVGGGNMIDKLNHPLKFGYDFNPCAIDALKIIRDRVNDLPKNNSEFTETRYKEMLKGVSNEYEWMWPFARFAYSFGGTYNGGWSRNRDKSDYVSRAYMNAVNQSPNLQNLYLECKSYDQIELESNMVLYCDPPYRGTTKYKNSFDHEKFEEWCLEASKIVKAIFISEYNMSDNFESIWSKEVSSNLTVSEKNKTNSEKLFIPKGMSLTPPLF